MLDYLNNLRLEHMVSILCMPPEKCCFPPDFCSYGTSSGIFWIIMKFLPLRDLKRKIKLLSHMHRQMYFKYLLIEHEQQQIDKGMQTAQKTLTYDIP